ncbi:MAG TPA: VOC family protein [Candidatus Sulfotelmatobacter sp.]|nr:VOC family protein [Candidatus Sulfotelmatobacter sp.]
MPKNKKTKKPALRRKSKSALKTAGPRLAKIATTIMPWLCVRGGGRAIDFYKLAFGAKEVFRLDDNDSVVARLSIEGAEFWLSDESPEHFNFSPESLGGITIRIILTVANPDAFFARAIKAGAKEVYPMTDEHDWRVGRVVDPFGHHWEIGRPLA